MKIKVEINPDMDEDEILITASQMSEHVIAAVNYLKEQSSKTSILTLTNQDQEYFIPCHRILFFETQEDVVVAHMDQQALETKYRLYELESLLPKSFVRISKSAIVNIDHIYSIERNISTSCVFFDHSDKVVYVSRRYFQPLKQKLIERGSL